MDYLIVRTRDETKRVHISEISVLILESTAISLSAYLLCELSRNKIDIIFCDEKRLPYGMLYPLYGSHDTSMKLRSQIKWNPESKKFIWAEIVRAKINGQAAVLKKFSENTAAEMLLSYLPQIQPNDTTNREGHAAKVYFNALFGMDFSRTEENNTNAALNYGYGVVLSVFAREAAANGYSTQIGIFHDNMFNPFNLASDLIEPFRPFIDKTVRSMNPEKFEHDEKVEIINVLNSKIMIDGKENYFLTAAKIYTKSIFNAIDENDISLIKFPSYEL